MTANQNIVIRLRVPPIRGHFGRTLSRIAILGLLFAATSAVAEEKYDDHLDRQTAMEPATSATARTVIVLPDIQYLHQPLPRFGVASLNAHEDESPRDARTQAWSPPELMYDAYGDWEVGVGTHRAVGLVVKHPFR